MLAPSPGRNTKLASELRRKKVKNTKRTHGTPGVLAAILYPFHRTESQKRTPLAPFLRPTTYDLGNPQPTTHNLQPEPPPDLI